jgi:hypothetical protein
LTISGSGTKTLGAATTINGDLTVSGSATLADGGFAMTGTAGGHFTLGAGTTFTTSRTSAWFPTLMPGANYSLDATSTVIYTATGDFSLPTTPSTYGNFKVSAVSGNKTWPSGTLTINGDLTLEQTGAPGADNYLTLSNTVNITGNIYMTNSSTSGSHLNALFPNGTVTCNNIIFNDCSYGQNWVSITLVNSVFTLNGSITMGTVVGQQSKQVIQMDRTATLYILGGGISGYGDIDLYSSSGIGAYAAVLDVRGDIGAGIKPLSDGGTRVVTPTIKLTGNFLCTSATLYDANSSTTIEFNGSSDQTASNVAYYHLTVNKTGGTVTLTNTTTINGNLTVTAGTFVDGGFAMTGTAGGHFTLGAGATYSTSRTATMVPTNIPGANYSLDATSTVKFTAAGYIELPSVISTYGNVEIASTDGWKTTLVSTTTVNGNFTMTQLPAGTDYNAFTVASGNTMNIAGDIIMNSTATTTTYPNVFYAELTGTVTCNNIIINESATGGFNIVYGGHGSLTANGSVTLGATSAATNRCCLYAYGIGTITVLGGGVSGYGRIGLFPDTWTIPLPAFTAIVDVRGNIGADVVTSLSSGGTPVLKLTGDFLSTSATFSTGSTIEFNGSSPQNIAAATTFYNLKLNNSTGLTLGGATTVSNTLTLTSGKITIGDYDLNIGTPGISGSIANYSSSNYIITNGTGTLNQYNIGTGQRTSVYYPIGISSSSYTPAQLDVSGTSTVDNFKMKVSQTVYSAGTTGTAYTANVVDRTWDITEGTAGGSSLTITSQWNSGDELSGFTRAACYVSHYTAGAWTQTQTAAACSGAGPYTRTSGVVTSFSPFALGASTTLPIELLSFNAIYKNGVVNLFWSTASEINNDYFTVERSIDSKSFEIITTVKGAGNSNTVLKYSAIDNNPPLGIIYYRLKQTDFDGTYKYSNVIAVKTNNKITNLILTQPYFNGKEIASNVINTGKETLKVEIIDFTGAVVYYKVFESLEENIALKLPADNIVKNTSYIMRVRNSKEIVMKKFVY